MRIILFLILLFIGATQTSMAQGRVQIGINGGIPTSDTGLSSNFGLAIDLAYLAEISEKFDAGLSTGYIIVFGEELPPGSININLYDITFIPFAASGRFELVADFDVGADIGYALGTNRFGESGIYLAPQLSYNLTNNIAVVSAFRFISQNDFRRNFHMVTAGVLIGFNTGSVIY